jgi:hypothetical protein
MKLIYRGTTYDYNPAKVIARRPFQHTRTTGKATGEEVRPGVCLGDHLHPKKNHLQVKRLLLDKEEQGDKQDFSELVQDLLDFWVQIQQGEEPETLISRFLVIQKSESSDN